MKVNYFIPGAQKSGTTALFEYLDLHPSIKKSPSKEPGYFSSDLLYSQGPKKYHRAQFGTWSALFGRKKGIDATPEYLYYPWVPERIYRYNPEARFIVLLRNPVERAFSAWNMFKTLNSYDFTAVWPYIQYANENVRNALYMLLKSENFPSFGTLIREEVAGKFNIEPSFVRRGLYADQINRYWQFFPKSAFLFLEDKDLKENKALALEQCARHLALDSFQWPEKLDDHHARSYGSDIDSGDKEFLHNFYIKPNEELYKLIGKKFNW